MEAKSLVKEIKITVVMMLVIFVVFAIYCYKWYYMRYQSGYLCRYAQFGAEITRREHLISNLKRAAVYYSEHEKEIMNWTSDSRKNIRNPKSTNRTDGTEGQLKKTLSAVAIAEQYPGLKASEIFTCLMKDIIEMENRIADWKWEYNNAARRQNTLLTTFPFKIVGIYGFCDVLDMYVSTEDDFFLLQKNRPQMSGTVIR